MIRKWEAVALCVTMPFFVFMAALAPTNEELATLPLALRCAALLAGSVAGIVFCRVLTRALFGVENSPWE